MEAGIKKTDSDSLQDQLEKVQEVIDEQSQEKINSIAEEMVEDNGLEDSKSKDNELSFSGVKAVISEIDNIEGTIAIPNVITISSVSASSTLEPNTNKYVALNLFDANFTKAWSEGKKGTGVGETILVNFSEQVPLGGIKLANGYYKSDELYSKNGKILSVLVETDAGYEKFDLNPGKAQLTRYSDELTFKNELVTSWVKITILDAVSGSKYDDVLISEMAFYDRNGKEYPLKMC